MNENTVKSLKYIYLFSLLQLYLIGFFLRENIAGGAEKDFITFTWPLIVSFKENFLITLKNYYSFGEGSTPLFHILNAYLNPFTFSQFAFQGSITLLSLLNVIFFSGVIAEKFKFSKLDSYVYSSIFLILPFFRSSAYWGLTENLGWLFLILSLKFYLKVESIKIKNNIKFVFLTCLFSSLALYTRPYLIFFPIFLVIYSIVDKKYSILKFFIFFYTLLSIPGFYLLYIWEGTIYIGQGEEQVNFIYQYHHPRFILQNLITVSTIFLFYLIPIEIRSIENKNYFSKKRILIFGFFLIIVSILSYFDIFQYIKEISLGGGVFHRINKIVFSENIYFFLFLSAVGFLIISDYFIISKKNKVLLFSLLIFCQPKYVFQEYFEPLILILFFSLFDLKKENKKMLMENKTMFIFIIYFLTYLTGGYLYRY